MLGSFITESKIVKILSESMKLHQELAVKCLQICLLHFAAIFTKIKEDISS